MFLISEIFLSFFFLSFFFLSILLLAWPLLPIHCRYREFLLRLITFSDTQQHLVLLLRTRDRPVAETYTWHHTTEIYQCPWRDSSSKSQQANGRGPTPQTVRPSALACGTLYCIYFHHRQNIVFLILPYNLSLWYRTKRLPGKGLYTQYFSTGINIKSPTTGCRRH
jgi:hypothetical protein